MNVAVEGRIDEKVAGRLVVHAGGQVGRVLGDNGKEYLRGRMSGYCQAARLHPWLVLVDLDHEAECPVPILSKWVPRPTRYLCFRVAVREVESWLLADADTLARYLSVRPERVPASPDALGDPKEAMVALARSSRDRQVKKDMLPAPGAGGPTGVDYASQLIGYIESTWRPSVAARHSASLRRAIVGLRRTIDSYRGMIS